MNDMKKYGESSEQGNTQRDLAARRGDRHAHRTGESSTSQGWSGQEHTQQNLAPRGDLTGGRQVREHPSGMTVSQGASGGWLRPIERKQESINKALEALNRKKKNIEDLLKGTKRNLAARQRELAQLNEELPLKQTAAENAEQDFVAKQAVLANLKQEIAAIETSLLKEQGIQATLQKELDTLKPKEIPLRDVKKKQDQLSTTHKKALDRVEQELAAKQTALESGKQEVLEKTNLFQRAEKNVSVREKEKLDADMTKQAYEEQINILKEAKSKKSALLHTYNKILDYKGKIEVESKSQSEIDEISTSKHLNDYERRQRKLEIINNFGSIDKFSMENLMANCKICFNDTSSAVNEMHFNSKNDIKLNYESYEILRNIFYSRSIAYNMQKHKWTKIMGEGIGQQVNHGSDLNEFEQNEKNFYNSYVKMLQSLDPSGASTHDDTITTMHNDIGKSVSILKNKLSLESLETKDISDFIQTLASAESKSNTYGNAMQRSQEALYLKFKEQLPDFFNFEPTFLAKERQGIDSAIEHFLTKIKTEKQERIDGYTKKLQSLQKDKTTLGEQFSTQVEVKRDHIQQDLRSLEAALKELGPRKGASNQVANAASAAYSRAIATCESVEQEKLETQERVKTLEQERDQLAERKEELKQRLEVGKHTKKYDANHEKYRNKKAAIETKQVYIATILENREKYGQQAKQFNNEIKHIYNKKASLQQEVFRMRRTIEQLPSTIQIFQEQVRKYEQNLAEIESELTQHKQNHTQAQYDLQNALELQERAAENEDRFGFMSEFRAAQRHSSRSRQ